MVSNVTKFTVVLLAKFAPATVPANAVGVEVLIPCVESPPYVAETNVVPGGKRFVVTLFVPPERVNGPNEPIIEVGSLVASAFSETSPVAPAGVTVTVALKFVPEGVPPVGLVTVVVVPVRTNVLHLVSRFVTLIDPSPVAKSY